MRIPFLSLVLLAGIAYVPALSGGFIWDDEGYIVSNLFLREPAGLGHIWFAPGETPQFYPLVFTTFWVEFHLWGLNPVGYHVINVLLHGLNSGLVWLLLRRLGVPGAWAAAAIFAVHPVHVESVAWITERKNLLSGALYLTSFLAFLRYSSWDKSQPNQQSGLRPVAAGIVVSEVRTGTVRMKLHQTDAADPAARDGRWYALSLVLFFGALLSKTVACSLPAVLLLVLWWKRGLPSRRDLLLVLPMFVLGVVMATITSWVERHYVGAGGPEWAFTPAERFLIAGRAWCLYVEKLFWPYPLMFNYPRWHIDPSEPWQYVYPAVMLGSGLILTAPLWPASLPLARLRQSMGRGPLTAYLIFTGTLVPALGFFNVYPMKFYFAADHFQYLASIALIALAVATCWRLCGSLALFSTHERTAIRICAVGGLLAALSVLTWKQCGIYHDPHTLWLDTVNKNPDAFLAQFNLGTSYYEHGQIERAIACYQRTEKIHPGFAELYVQWGIALGATGNLTGACQMFEKALASDSQNPVRFATLPYERADLDARIYFNLGLALEKLKKPLESQAAYEKSLERAMEVLRSEPAHGDALLLAGQALMKLEKPREAVAYFERLLRLRPRDPQLRALLEDAQQKALLK